MDFLNKIANIIQYDCDIQTNIITKPKSILTIPKSILTIPKSILTKTILSKPKSILSKPKQVRFSQTNIVVFVPKLSYDVFDYSSYTMEHFKNKYANIPIKYNISIRIPLDLLTKNNIDNISFDTINNDTINNDNLINHNVKYDNHYMMHIDQEYNVYEFNELTLDISKTNSFIYKIIFDHQDINKPFFQNQKKVLSQNKFDIQEILEEYEDNNSFIEFDDKYTKIIFIIDLYIDDLNHTNHTNHLNHTNHID
jgi:hypothetical protein